MTGNVPKSFFEILGAIGRKRFSLYISYGRNVMLEKDGDQVDRSCAK